MMDTSNELLTPIDFIRYGVTQSCKHGLWFGHGTDNVWDEMVALVLGSLKLPFDVNPMVLTARLTTEERQQLSTQLYRRIVERVPVPYLTQIAYFAGLSFYVDERVLIPRSPLAELIEQQFRPWIVPETVTRILDLCTGSGCIAVACAEVFPAADVTAVDLSESALAVAKLNIQNHHLEESIQLIQSDVWQSVPQDTYDIIVSNPPYVSHEEMLTLPREYQYEPAMALEAEDSGLNIIHRILEQATEYLAPDGILVVEVGNREQRLCEAYPDLPFIWLEFERGGQGVFLLTAEQLRGQS